MKTLTIVFAVLIALIQYPLWLGKGGWAKVWDYDRQLETRRAENDKLQERNNALAAEVADLKQGQDAIEERARYELGFIRNDEVFFQIVEPPAAPPVQ